MSLPKYMTLIWIFTSFCAAIDIECGDAQMSKRIQGDNTRPLLDYAMETVALTTPVFEYALTYGLGKSGDLSLNRAALAAVMTYTTIGVLKYTIGRERPERRYRPRLWNTRITPSFPSGHVASSALFATWVSTHYPKMTIPAAVFGLVSAYSQVYVGNHYVVDALGGILLGVLVGKLVL
ncbi:MAG: phosphatase PAP2 family protein [Candidatus Neomarinimicrobiota bacterium]